MIIVTMAFLNYISLPSSSFSPEECRSVSYCMIHSQTGTTCSGLVVEGFEIPHILKQDFRSWEFGRRGSNANVTKGMQHVTTYLSKRPCTIDATKDRVMVKKY